MKIGLISSHTPFIKLGLGGERYCNALLHGIKQSGYEVELFSIPDLKIPYGKLFYSSFLLAKKLISKNMEIYHSLEPLPAISFTYLNLKKIKRKITTFHDLIPYFCENAKLHFFMYKIVLKNSDIIIATSKQTKNELQKYFRVSAKKIKVINPGISNKFKPLSKNQKDYFVIGYLGSMKKRKGLDYIIKSFYILKKTHPELKCKLEIWGERNFEYPKLLRLTKLLKLKNVVFPGFVPEKDIVKVYNSFDVYLFGSIWEGFGLTILEAQACGVPVIIRSDAHISPEVSRYCLKAHSPHDMAKKIHELLTDIDMKNKISKMGIKYSKNFTWEKTVKKTLNTYEELL